jgi:hypothetical protein
MSCYIADERVLSVVHPVTLDAKAGLCTAQLYDAVVASFPNLELQGNVTM